MTGGQQTAGARLRALLARPGAVAAPGVYDALGARLVELAGFDAVYMTGFGAAAALLGRPDVGLLSAAEMVENARRIVQATTLPVLADADTGYGNPLNVMRTVELYEAAGVAGIHLEDQVAPKRCGHLDGKQVIPAEEMAQKLRAAVRARRDPNFVLIARTDAAAVLGFDEALRRGRLYADVGADLLFIEAPASEEQCAAIGAAFPDRPLLYNWAETGRSPLLPPARLAALGFKLIIYPISLLLTATHAMQAMLATLRADGSSLARAEAMTTFAAFNDLIGLPAVLAAERDFAVDVAPVAGARDRAVGRDFGVG